MHTPYPFNDNEETLIKIRGSNSSGGSVTHIKA